MNSLENNRKVAFCCQVYSEDKSDKNTCHLVSTLLFSSLINSGCSPTVTDPSASDATAACKEEKNEKENTRRSLPSSWYYRWVWHRLGHNQMKKTILGFCGIKVAKISEFAPVKAQVRSRERTGLLWQRNMEQKPKVYEAMSSLLIRGSKCQM